MKKILLFVLAVSASITVNSQTADEIITNYFENTGGMENWGKLEGIQMSAKVNQGGYGNSIGNHSVKKMVTK